MEALQGAQQGVEEVIATARATAVTGSEAGYSGHLATFNVVKLPAATEDERELIREQAGQLPYVGAKPSRPIFGPSETISTVVLKTHGTVLAAPSTFATGRKRTSHKG